MVRTRLSRRDFVRWSAMAAGVTTLASCAPAPAQAPASPVKETVVVTQKVPVTVTPPPAGPVTITFWHAYNPLETETLEKKLIPAFEKAHSGVKVQAQQVPYDEFHRKLLTAIAGGTAPDLIRSDIIWVPEFADMGALVPLDSVMSDFGTFKGAVFEGPLSTNFYKGHYYGLPIDTNCRVLIYNVAMYKAAGVEAPPKTIDEFVSVAKKIRGLGNGKYAFADGGTYAWAVNPWIWSFGGDVTNADITKATGTLNGPETVAAYEFLKTMVNEGYFHPGIKGGGVDTWAGFGKGEIAMVLEGPWFPPSFIKQYPDVKFGYGMMPAGKGGGVSVVGGEDIVMFQQSKNKQAAADFIRYMLSPEAQLSLAEAGQMPVLKALSANDAIKNHPFFGYFLEQLKSARARTPHPAWPKIEDVLTQAGQAILQGTQTPKQALDAAAAKIDGYLSAH